MKIEIKHVRRKLLVNYVSKAVIERGGRHTPAKEHSGTNSNQGKDRSKQVPSVLCFLYACAKLCIAESTLLLYVFAIIVNKECYHTIPHKFKNVAFY